MRTTVPSSRLTPNSTAKPSRFSAVPASRVLVHDGMQLCPLPLVQEIQRTIEDAAAQCGPRCGMPARHLVLDSRKGDDVVVADLPGLSHEEAVTQVGLAVGEPQGL